MKKAVLVCMIGLAITATSIAAGPPEVTIKALPASVIKTIPASGTKVSAATTKQIKVTFSKDMKDNSWTFTQISGDSFPKIVGQPKYLKDKRTCVLTVKLKPKTTYAIWLNTQKFQNFKDLAGRPSIPYLLVFETQ
jgi:hypothetical protein